MAMNLDSMRTRLETKRSELRETIAELRTLYSASTSSSGTPEEGEDLEDAAREIVEREEEQSIFANQQVLLSEIEQALKRLDEGTYGQCCQCGLPIPERRLEAIPWATRDVVCEARREAVKVMCNQETM